MMRRFWLALACLSVSTALVVAAQQLKPQGWTFPTVTLETLPASPLLLTPPKDVEGDFEVAKAAPTVQFAVLPGQWQDAALWSNWGDSLCGPDGNFYCSIGDHHHPYGDAFVYRVDPKSGEVKMVVDYNEVVQMPRTDYAPGKIHCPLMDGGDGWMYFIGYRGGGSGLNDEHHYKGDWMLRYEYTTGKTENLGIPVAGYSVPCSVLDEDNGVIYGLAPDEKFFAYDMKAGKEIYHDGPLAGMPRAILVAADGRVWYSDKQGHFVRYDLKTNKITALELMVPADGGNDTPIMRSASVPDASGVAYGITKNGLIFSFDTHTEKVTPITQAFVIGPGYTAICKLDPTGRYLYYVPGSHGGGGPAGTPVVQLDTRTGKRKVLAFLNEYLHQQKNYNCGGSFGTALSADGSQLFICFNGRDLGKKVSWESGTNPDFDLCAVVLLTIPASERP